MLHHVRSPVSNSRQNLLDVERLRLDIIHQPHPSALAAKTTPLRPAAWNRRSNRLARVDVHVAGVNLLRWAQCMRHRRHEDARVVFGVEEDGGLDVEAALALANTTSHKLGFVLASMQEAHDTLEPLVVDERAEEHFGVGGRPHGTIQLLGPDLEVLHILVRNVFMHKCTRRCHTSLARFHEEVLRVVPQRILDIGIGEDERGRLAADFERHALEVAVDGQYVRESSICLGGTTLNSQFLHLLPSKHRSRKAHLVDIHVARQRRANLAITSNDVDHTRRKPRLLDQITNLEYFNGRVFRSPVDERAASCEGSRALEPKEQSTTIPATDPANTARSCRCHLPLATARQEPCPSSQHSI
jgi:hypothetical protein